jgi:hypothetical protein
MHYKDGTEAKAGDLVKGTVYNTKGVIVGVMLGITPGSSACNCRVALVRILPGDPLPTFRAPATNGPEDKGSPYITGVFTSEGYALPHLEADNADRIADRALVGVKVDYSQCDHLELVHRPEA